MNYDLRHDLLRNLKPTHNYYYGLSTHRRFNGGILRRRFHGCRVERVAARQPGRLPLHQRSPESAVANLMLPTHSL
jgi:hypothetical protein